MAALYIVAVLNYGVGYWGYARSFAEAALVGGLADWFAVTALFRRPLGLPIPHTAIIPRSKDRIAAALGQFVTINFLAPDIVAERVKNEDIAKGLAKQVAEPATAERFAEAITDALPEFIDLLDDAAVGRFVHNQIDAFAQSDKMSAALGKGLQFLTDQGRHTVLIDAAVEQGWRLLEQHEEAIRKQIKSNTGWIWRLIALDARAADSLIAALEETLREVAADPEHPIRLRVTAMLQEFSDKLQHDDALRARVEQGVADIMASPAVSTYLESVWRDVKAGLRHSLSAPKSQIREAISEGIQHFATALVEDDEARQSLNVRLRGLLVEAARRHGGDAGFLITETIRSWDAKTVVEKLEQNVGPDLQYIRINGTLIGGLIGLGIHQLTLWLM
jgi:uncharacterized membrane-anchored protein YjiN (DUF445 family)